MKLRLSGMCAVLGLVLAAAPVWAHHSTQAEFDTSKKIDITGTIAKMEWINPHAYLYVDVKDGNKVTHWAFELVGPTGLARIGLRKSDGGIKTGDTIHVMGFPAKDGSNLGFIQELTLASGRHVTVWNQDPYAR